LSSTFGPGATENLVDFNSTLQVAQRKALTPTLHWTWCKGNHCRLQLDFGPGETESAFDGQRLGEVGTVSPGVKQSQDEADS